MYEWSLDKHLHLGTMLFGGLSFILLAFISVKHLVLGWASSVWAIMCNALVCRLVRRLLMCVFVQHESRCRHVLVPFSG